MHRHDLLEKITRYQSRYPEELETIERFRTFIKGHSDCFERTLPIGHITASAWIVNPPGTRTLLTHHRKLNQWFQLGGHCDGNPDTLEAALREAREESGLPHIEPVSPEIFDLDIHPIPARGDMPLHDHYDVRYALRSMNDAPFIVSEESHDLAWVQLNDLSTYTRETSMQRMCAKWTIAHQKKASIHE